MIKPTSILNDFKDILISEEGAIGDMECVSVTDGITTWKGWRYDSGTSIGLLGNAPGKDFDWDGVKWKVAKKKDKPKHLAKKSNSITVHPGAAIMRFPSFIASSKGKT